jgi:hypothetical protein
MPEPSFCFVYLSRAGLDPQWRWVEKNPDGYLTQQKQG